MGRGEMTARTPGSVLRGSEVSAGARAEAVELRAYLVRHVCGVVRAGERGQRVPVGDLASLARSRPRRPRLRPPPAQLGDWRTAAGD